VRELAHVIERAVLMARGSEIDSLDLGSGSAVVADAPAASAAAPALNGMTLEQTEQAMIRNALDQCRGNIQRAAEVLGLSRGALYRRLEKYGLATEE